MTHDYQISGMTCSGCEQKVKTMLFHLPTITSIDVSKETGKATISMDEHIGVADLQNALDGPGSKYQITAIANEEKHTSSKSFFTTYKPVLLLFAYISGIAFISSWQNGNLSGMLFMRYFMAGFFLAFSFFKLLNLKAFAESYAMYDIVAKKIYAWGYCYAFIELLLGLAYLVTPEQLNHVGIKPSLVHWITLIVMSISIIGVLQSLLNKRKIQCACLGAVFDLPMSTITVIEDLLMIAMSALMLILN